jgi:hypothetical protein
MRKILGCFLIAIIVLTTPLWAEGGTFPLAAAERYFTIIEKGEVDAIARLMADDENYIPEEDPETFKALQFMVEFFHMITHEFGQLTAGDGTAELEVEISSPDMMWVFNESITEFLPIAFELAMSEEEVIDSQMETLLMELMMKYLFDPQAPRIVTPVVMELELQDGLWHVMPTDEFLTALLGNFDQAISE